MGRRGAIFLNRPFASLTTPSKDAKTFLFGPLGQQKTVFLRGLGVLGDLRGSSFYCALLSFQTKVRNLQLRIRRKVVTITERFLVADAPRNDTLFPLSFRTKVRNLQLGIWREAAAIARMFPCPFQATKTTSKSSSSAALANCLSVVTISIAPCLANRRLSGSRKPR